MRRCWTSVRHKMFPKFCQRHSRAWQTAYYKTLQLKYHRWLKVQQNLWLMLQTVFFVAFVFLISQGNNNWWEIHILIHQQYEMWPTQYQPRSRNISAWQSRRRNCSILPIAVNYSGRRRRSVLITKKGWQSQRCPERENKASSSSSSSSCCGLVLMKTHWLLPNLPEYVVTVGGTIFQ